jgi:hypothetical protein
MDSQEEYKQYSAADFFGFSHAPYMPSTAKAAAAQGKTEYLQQIRNWYDQAFIFIISEVQLLKSIQHNVISTGNLNLETAQRYSDLFYNRLPQLDVDNYREDILSLIRKSDHGVFLRGEPLDAEDIDPKFKKFQLRIVPKGRDTAIELFKGVNENKKYRNNTFENYTPTYTTSSRHQKHQNYHQGPPPGNQNYNSNGNGNGNRNGNRRRNVN